MVKYTVWNNAELGKKCENTKFTRELNTYGVDKNGIGEELLFPIRLNGKPGENQETNLATYLVKYREYKKTIVKVKKTDNDKEGFLNPYLLNHVLFLVKYCQNSKTFLASKFKYYI